MFETSSLVKRCRVCGDKASGFNYNGLCCESCKVFFLRNVPKQNKFKCVKDDEKCEIDYITRKNCPKCRLQKCLAIGMFLKAKRQNPQSNRQTTDSHIRNVLENLDKTFNFPIENALDHILPSCSYLSTACRKKYASDLIVSERQVISNVQNVIHDTFVDERTLQITGILTELIDSFNISEMYVRPIIRFCKSIPAFKQLIETDQMIILKPFFFEILMCRLSFIWDMHKYGYPVLENEAGNRALFINIEIANKFKNKDLYQSCIEFQIHMNNEMENDFTIRDLLIASMLFKPRDNISNQENVRYQYSLYCRMLLRYLEHKYKNVQQAQKKYSSLMKMSDDISMHRECARIMMLSEIDIQQLSLVLVELFSLDEK